VLKPVSLSASRGVIRADDPAGFEAALTRVRAILAAAESSADGDGGDVLVESFIPGSEVALEGMLTDGALTILALFDKPDPLDGPFFEETVYVTPSRLPEEAQRAIADEAERGAAGLGLRSGPIHAELRLNDQGAWIVEIAARSIGGLCSDALEFSGGVSLEELILMDAVGADVTGFERERQPSGVMMLPVPRGGVLRSVGGVEQARAVDGVRDVTISIPIGQAVVPLPEGDRYLGFIFARGDTPEDVEAALREAQQRLAFEIEPETFSPSPVGSRDLSQKRGRSYRPPS
jgi:biotin carboxylase